MRGIRAGRPMSVALAACAALAACDRGGDPVARKGKVLVEDSRPSAPKATSIGVSAVDFKCDEIAPIESVEAAIGQPVEQVDESAFTPPQGVAKPCTYQSAIPDQPGEWSFDIDCRERATGDGERLMTQYATEPGSKPVLVGRTGIDHHGEQLLFFDDDAPCYVRVNGQGEAERLALAKVIADGLTRRNAPGRVTFVEVTTGPMQEAK